MLKEQILVADAAADVTVVRRHYRTEFCDIPESIMERAANLSSEGQAIYLGPRVTITCPQPTRQFWQAVYAEFSSWRRTARQTFSRRRVEDRDSWKDPAKPSAPPAHHRNHRLVHLTGFLIINGESVPLRDWPSREAVGYRPKRRRARSRKTT
jgi:hypothetical protein